MIVRALLHGSVVSEVVGPPVLVFECETNDRILARAFVDAAEDKVVHWTFHILREKPRHLLLERRMPVASQERDKQ